MAIAIGDIHGHLSALQALVAQLPTAPPLIFLGDYIDRGPESAGVIDYLVRLATQRPCRFLRGNHEALLISASLDGDDAAPWLMNGGPATLRSYSTDEWSWRDAPDRAAFLPAEHLDFLQNLENYVEDRSHIFVHAGIDLAVLEMSAQDPQVLMWIRERFYLRAKKWKGKPIVFGHTPTQTMGLGPGEVFRNGAVTGIDTGRYLGGPLTALDADTGQLYQAWV